MQKMGISYPDLEPVNEFYNRVQVPGFCYTRQSLDRRDYSTA